MPKLTKRLRSRSASVLRASSLLNPGTPGPFTEDVLRSQRASNFLGASPSSAAKLRDYRRQLFMGPPVTRTAKKMATQSSSSTNLEASSSSQDLQDNDAAPLDPFQVGDLSEEPQDATPRRNQQPRGNQPQRRRAEGPDLEDVLTQLTQEILTLRREGIAHQPQQPQNVEVPEDPNFNWNLRPVC